MIYEIIKHTVIDSMHEHKEVYATIDCAEEHINRIVVPNLNKLVDITNKQFNLIQAKKAIYFKVKALNAIDIVRFAQKIAADITDKVDTYNGFVAISNKTTKRYNKLNKKPLDKGCIKPFDIREFDNPFVNYNVIVRALEEDVILALGREQEIF